MPMNNNLSGLPRYLFISGAGAGGAVLSGRALFPLVTRKPMISSRRHGCGGAGVLSGHARFPYIRREPIPITASHDLLSSRCSRHTDGQSGGRLPGEYSDKSAAVRRPPPPPPRRLRGNGLRAALRNFHQARGTFARRWNRFTTPPSPQRLHTSCYGC